MSRCPGPGYRSARTGRRRLERLHGARLAMADGPTHRNPPRPQIIMLDISMTFEDGQQRSVRVPPPLLIGRAPQCGRSEEHTSELQSLMRISYAVVCFMKKRSIHST